MRTIHALLAGIALFSSAAWSQPAPAGGGEPKLGAVASESDICSRIGTTLLQDGGNAVDALVGTVFCVGVVGMYHSGIGGGGFMLVRTSNGMYEHVDFRETAPAAAFQDMFLNNTDASMFGGLSRYCLPLCLQLTLLPRWPRPLLQCELGLR